MKYLIALSILFFLSCEDQTPSSSNTSIPTLTFKKAENTWLNDTTENLFNIETSIQKWDELTEEYGTTYKYYYNNYCSPNIFHNTSVLVSNNKVIEVYSIYSKQIVTEDSFYWEEFDTIFATSDSNISHLSFYRSVDEIYNFTKNMILKQNTDSNTVFIEFHKNGLLKQSFYWHFLTADAPNEQVQIDSLFFGEIM